MEMRSNVGALPSQFTGKPNSESSSRRFAILNAGLLIGLCIVNVLMVIFTVASIYLTLGVSHDVSDLSGKVNFLRQEVAGQVTGQEGKGQTSGQGQLGPITKSFNIRGFDTSKGFNITVEFPESVVIGENKQTGSGYDQIVKLLETLKDDLRSSGTTCKTGNNNGVLMEIQKLSVVVDKIRSSQETILNKLNTSSSVSQTASFQKLESTIIDQVQLVQTRLEVLEKIAIDVKSQTNKLQSSLSSIQSKTSQVAVNTGLNHAALTGIKVDVQTLVGKPTCVGENSQSFKELRQTLNNVDSKTNALQQGVTSLTTGDKSLPSIAANISKKLTGVEKASSEMKSQCQNSETKLAEVLAKVGLPTEPSTVKYASVIMSYCSSTTGCLSVRAPTTQCYKISQGGDSTWHQARQACSRMGGYLAEINSDQESKHVASMLKSEGFYWIGASDEAREGKWQWNHSGKSMSLSAWKEDEPGSSYSLDCLAINKDGWSWSAKVCTTNYGYVCEKSANDCNDWMS